MHPTHLSSSNMGFKVRIFLLSNTWTICLQKTPDIEYQKCGLKEHQFVRINSNCRPRLVDAELDTGGSCNELVRKGLTTQKNQSLITHFNFTYEIPLMKDIQKKIHFTFTKEIPLKMNRPKKIKTCNFFVKRPLKLGEI